MSYFVYGCLKILNDKWICLTFTTSFYGSLSLSHSRSTLKECIKSCQQNKCRYGWMMYVVISRILYMYSECVHTVQCTPFTNHFRFHFISFFINLNWPLMCTQCVLIRWIPNRNEIIELNFKTHKHSLHFIEIGKLVGIDINSQRNLITDGLNGMITVNQTQQNVQSNNDACVRHHHFLLIQNKSGTQMHIYSHILRALIASKMNFQNLTYINPSFEPTSQKQLFY